MLPLRVLPPRLPFEHPYDPVLRLGIVGDADRLTGWVERIKRQARANLANEWEYIRIAWHARYRRPKYDRYDDYTPEEMLLETWEQHFYEHPDSIEAKGISTHKNKSTGYKFYQTGDPLIDSLEESFGRGEVPDLQAAFGHIKEGEDIWRAPVFKHPVYGAMPARNRPTVVGQNEKGEKISVSGGTVEETDFKSDDWLKEALANDPVIKAMADRVGMNNA